MRPVPALLSNAENLPILGVPTSSRPVRPKAEPLPCSGHSPTGSAAPGGARGGAAQTIRRAPPRNVNPDPFHEGFHMPGIFRQHCSDSSKVRDSRPRLESLEDRVVPSASTLDL